MQSIYKTNWEKAHIAAQEAAKQTNFIRYKDAPESSVFQSLYIQIFKLAEIAAFTELEKGKSEEEAIQAVKDIMSKH